MSKIKAIGVICVILVSGFMLNNFWIIPQPEQTINRNPAYSSTIVVNVPIKIIVEPVNDSNVKGWSEHCIVVTNPKDIAVNIGVRVTYIPYIWDTEKWTPRTERKAILLKDVVVQPRGIVKITIPLKQIGDEEEAFIFCIPVLESMNEWNESDVPAYSSVIVLGEKEDVL